MKTQSLKQQLQEVRRNHIIDAAIDVIAEHGFQQTTIKQIAKQAGIADGTIYNYFDNKDAIMTAIVARITEAERRDLNIANSEQLDMATFMQTFLPQRLQEVEAQLPLFKIILAETLNNADLREQINSTIYEPSFAIAETYFQQLMNAKKIPHANPTMMARLSFSPAFGLLMLRLLGDTHVTEHWDEYSNAIAQQMTHLIQHHEQ